MHAENWYGPLLEWQLTTIYSIKELGSTIKLPTCGGILSLNSLELLMEERSEMDMSGNSSQGVLS